MSTDAIYNTLNLIALNCNPPFSEKEVSAKIQSALKRNDSQQKNLSQEVREFAVTSNGAFLTPDVYQRLQVTSRSEKKTVKQLLRLKEKGVIERVGQKDGCYRKIESDCEPVDWTAANTDFLDVWLPFDLSDIAGIQSGNLIIFAGAKDSGKTAALMNIAKENRQKYKVHYFSSEMGGAEFKLRAKKFLDITPEQWNIKFYERASSFQDVIKPGSGNLNIIDFFEIHDNFYKISESLSAIHQKLNGGLAVIAIQKAPGVDLGRGGTFSLEKARLYISLDYHKAKVISCKNFRANNAIGNPRGKEYNFKLIDGCRYKKELGWHTPAPKE